MQQTAAWRHSVAMAAGPGLSSPCQRVRRVPTSRSITCRLMQTGLSQSMSSQLQGNCWLAPSAPVLVSGMAALSPPAPLPATLTPITAHGGGTCDPRRLQRAGLTDMAALHGAAALLPAPKGGINQSQHYYTLYQPVTALLKVIWCKWPCALQVIECKARAG